MVAVARPRPASALQLHAHRDSGSRPVEETYVTYAHLHIPKCGGVSFRADVESQLPSNAVVVSKEVCYDDLEPFARGVTLLRQPRAHVLSQYMHCTTSPDGVAARAHMPDSFAEWVSSWDALRKGNETKAFCCYDPVDMQSYVLSCPANTMIDQTYGVHVMKKPRVQAEADVELALRNLQSLWFVGLVEAYRESVCVFLARASGALPPYCDCEDPATWWQGAPYTAEDHNSTAHRTSDIAAGTVETVDALTVGDRRLYAAGVRRFLQELHEVERTHGVRVLCREISSEPPSALLEAARSELQRDGPAALVSVGFGECEETWGL